MDELSSCEKKCRIQRKICRAIKRREEGGEGTRGSTEGKQQTPDLSALIWLNS